MSVKAYPLEYHHSDVLIIGAGGAGLRAAIAAKRTGARVSVISKVPPTRSHTVAAQGGINAALGNHAPDDWRWHMFDTLKGADWLADADAVALLCERAPAAIVELEQMGMAFTRREDGKIYQRVYGGQTRDFGKGGLAYRACAVADRTGHALLHTLYQQALRSGVQVCEEWFALDLLMREDSGCSGALLWNVGEGTLHVHTAHTTILATGGFGQAYASTTASSICTGDGGGMALRAGLALQDMEFVQFHPTGLYGTGLLITEGARGEGGFLENALGERFMQRCAPPLADLTSRDIISRYMMKEIAEGRGCGPKGEYIHLRIDHLDAQTIREKLPTVCDVAQRFSRVDARREPIPVIPTVHYTMGGIPTNAQCEVVRYDAANAQDQLVPGLMAIGEAASTSVHGANRLGCNSLLDLVVFGELAGTLAGARAMQPPHRHTAAPTAPKAAVEKSLGRFDALRYAKGEHSGKALRSEMQRLMQHHAGVFRSGRQLAQGLQAMHALAADFTARLRLEDRSLQWNQPLAEALESDNLLAQSLVTLVSAEARTESRGAHFREDFPARDEAQQTHSLAYLEEHTPRIVGGGRAVVRSDF